MRSGADEHLISSRSGARLSGRAWARQDCPSALRGLDPPGALPVVWQLPERHQSVFNATTLALPKVQDSFSIGRNSDHTASMSTGFSGESSRIHACQARYAGSLIIDIEERC